MSSAAIMKHQPLEEVVSRSFDCFFPATIPGLPKPRHIPQLKTPSANLAWASAYLDYAGKLINDREDKHEELATKYNSALDTIGQQSATIELLEKKNATLSHINVHLKSDISQQKAAYGRLNAALAKSKAEEKCLTEDLNTTKKQLTATTTKVESLRLLVEKLNKQAYETWQRERASDEVDHKALDDAAAKNSELAANLSKKERELFDAKEEIHAAKGKQELLEKQISDLKEQIGKLREDIADRDRTIGRNEIDVCGLRKENETSKTESIRLSKELGAKISELEATEKDLEGSRNEVTKLYTTLAEKSETIARYAKLLDDQETTNAKLHEDSQNIIREQLDKIEVLVKHDKEDDQKLATFAQEIEVLSNALNKALADDESDKNQISQLAQTVSILEDVQTGLQKRIGELNLHDVKDDVEITNLKKTLKDLEANLAETKKQKADSEAASGQAKIELEKLRSTVEKVTSDDEKDKSEIKRLEEAQKAGEKQLKDLKAQTETAQKEIEAAKQKVVEAEEARKSAEAAAAFAAAERDEAKKPLLENGVKLAHPIALAGSLKGAPRGIDDETFLINSSFPVKLYNYESNKIYISTNGLLTFDSPTNNYHYNIYKALPYCAPTGETPLPDVVLAPFWADLCISVNTPQGIYYEETGTAPNRKLEIEWYMSRYGDEKQYYHFSVTLEEAKKNLATFKYYAAKDNGARCTIGSQGPKGKESTQYSHNSEKRDLVGTQLIFDTIKDKYVKSKFTVTEKKAVNGTVSKDTKLTNGVSVNVKEVINI